VKRAVFGLLLLGVLATACGEEPSEKEGAKGKKGQAAGSAKPAAAPRAPGKQAAVAAPSSSVPPPPLLAQDMDWQESERSRDPFRSFAETFVDEARGKVRSQREVMLDEYSLDELKLVGIVLGADPPVVLLVDPAGKGHTIRRGQFVGRAEIVQSGGQSGAAYEVNWRLETIRDGDIVFVREDPQNPDVPSATKVIPLRPEGSIPSGAE
jgi:type IV pilus assembly protein PilP